MRLQIDVFDNQKIVAVWLTKAERDDGRVRQKLRVLREIRKDPFLPLDEAQANHYL